MKKLVLFFLLMPGIIFAADKTIFDNGIWYLDNHTLTTNQHAPFSLNGRVFDHSVNYVTPIGERGSSDACLVSSPTTLECDSGDNVTYNLEAHSATLGRKFGSPYIYYDKDYMPEGSPLSGDWHRNKTTRNCLNSETRIVIPYHLKDATTFQNVDRYSASGFSKGAVFYLAKNKYSGKLALSPTPGQAYYYSFYLYDKDNNPIYDISQINTLAKLNDSNGYFYSECDLIKQ